MDTSPSVPSSNEFSNAMAADLPNIMSDLDSLVDQVAPPPPKPLNEWELQFVTFMHQSYGMHGAVMSKDAANELLGLPAKTYDTLMADSRVIDALTERGVPCRPADKKDPNGNVIPLKNWQKNLQLHSLTPIQLIVANTMLDLVDTRSQKKKLQDLNVSTSTYNTWLKDEVFQGYLRERAEALLGENQHEAHLALLDKVRMGDMKAIAYYNEMTGRYTQASATQQNVNQIAVDVQNLLVKIIEIINDEVDDPRIAANIADRFKGLMTARTIAGELMETNVDPNTGQVLHQPSIAAARELTPELQQLMNRGQGYE